MVAPVAGSGSTNGGAEVPRASIVDSVAMPASVAFIKLETEKAGAAAQRGLSQGLNYFVSVMVTRVIRPKGSTARRSDSSSVLSFRKAPEQFP